jgi:Trk-type K+ transport system membrane component
VWKTGAKLILIMVMFLGRHRGLPDNIDAAIVIPDQKGFRKSFMEKDGGKASVCSFD